MRRKVSIIGAGNVLDLNEAGPVDGYDFRLAGSNGYEETRDSDVVVITSGLPRKPGMSRDDLLQKNFEIVKGVTQQVVRHSPRAVLIVVSNPLDVANTHAFVLGGHGDTMVPLPRYSTVSGIPITELLPKEQIDAIVQRTRDGGIEVVNLLKSGSAYYAPASSIVQMVESILLDEHRILPCAVSLNGEYGHRDLFLGVPARLGAGGLEKVIEIKLTAEEKSALDRSAAAVRELVTKLPV